MSFRLFDNLDVLSINHFSMMDNRLRYELINNIKKALSDHFNDIDYDQLNFDIQFNDHSANIICKNLYSLLIGYGINMPNFSINKLKKVNGNTESIYIRGLGTFYLTNENENYEYNIEYE